MMHIAMVGGGAASFLGAIACAEANPQAQITILEGSAQLLSKVRISGGGRCNVTHACFEPAELVQYYPRGNKALRGAFSRFQPRNTVDWFRTRGVKLKTEADGRMFPVSDDSETIVDCLLRSAQAMGVQIYTSWMGVSLERVGGRFLLTSKSGQHIRCDRLLLATGSHPMGYRLAQQLGHWGFRGEGEGAIRDSWSESFGANWISVDHPLGTQWTCHSEAIGLGREDAL
jgi:predicted Rossmann fold flavoprotein